jgi:hypothetical protein
MKGIAIKTGGGIGGQFRYVTRDGKPQEIRAQVCFIDGTQDNKKDYLREQAALRSLRPDVRKPGLHFVLSLPDGDHMSREDWRRAVQSFTSKIGLDGHSYYAVKHTDEDHEHIHILANAISFDGKRWDTQKSGLRAQQAATEIEAEFGFDHTRTLSEFRREEGIRRRPIGRGDVDRFKRTGRVSDNAYKAIRDRKKKEVNHEPDRAAYSTADERVKDDQPADRGIARTAQHPKYPTGAPKHPIGTDQQGNKQAFGQHQKPSNMDRPASEPAPDSIPDFQQNRSVNMNENDIETGGSADHITRPEAAPVLGGRLRAEFDQHDKNVILLFWKDRVKPTFCYKPNEKKVELLARPDKQNVAAFFDLCAEKNMRPLKLFGDDDFINLAVAEAVRRGYPLDLSDPRVRAAHDRLQARQAPQNGAVAAVPYMVSAAKKQADIDRENMKMAFAKPPTQEQQEQQERKRRMPRM